MTRRMSPTRRARIFTAHDGVCHICGGAIDGVRETWDVEHIIPLEISRDDEDSNLAPAHKRCHVGKTKADAGDIAKCKRVERKHKGAHRPRNKIPGSRGTGLRKRMDGFVVRVKE